MKKILYLFLMLIVFIPYNIHAFNIKSKNAVLYNMNEDTILYEVNKDEEVYIASMTKIMTALVALEKIDNINEKVTMTNDMFYRLVEENASVAGFSIGEIVTYEDLLYGLMLPSGADAAQGLAIATYGSIDAFVERMNQKASELGLKHTHFVNTTGLDNKKHYSSVNDVAIILKEALKNEKFKNIFVAEKYTSSNGVHTFYSTRTKYGIDTSFITGSKTGFTYDAGLCLASTSTYNGVDYLLVTAGASYDNKTNHLIDAKTIYKHYQDNYEYRKVSEIGDFIVKITLDDRQINYYSNKEINKYLNKNCEIKKEYIGKEQVDSENLNSNKIGEYIIKCDDEILYKQDINLVLDISKKDNFKNFYIIYILSGLIVIAFIVLLITKWRKK